MSHPSETEYDVDSDSEYLGDGEDRYDSGLERSEVFANCEEKYERSMADLILFFEKFSK